jgi:peptidoglycan/xylan/chitin deacetylase (PgdA/CDA1 family)
MGRRDAARATGSDRDRAARGASSHSAAPCDEEEAQAQPAHKPQQEGFSVISEKDVPAYSPKLASSPNFSTRSTRIGVVVLVALVLAGILGLQAWNSRTVEVSVDGTSVSVKAGSSLDELVSAAGLQLTPGNFMSIGGNVITEGGGDAYEATLNGATLTQDAISKTTVSDGQSFEFSDGADTTEACDEQVVDLQPKLEVQGKAGAITYVAQWGKAGKKRVKVGETSGETVDDGVVDAAQDAVIVRHNFNFDDGRKLIALTFDDGPSQYTQRYLDILAQYGVKATFFNLGQNADTYPDLEKACVAAGCQVASHTFDHKQLTTLSGDDVYSELTTAFTSIYNASGTSTTMFRPPYGSFSADTWLLSRGCVSASFIWNIDSEDWRLPGTDKIVSNVVNNAYSGAIVLMHDGGGNRDEDVAALPTIIQTLQGEGYTFVTLDELMAADDSIPDDIATGDATMPADCVWPTELA